MTAITRTRPRHLLPTMRKAMRATVSPTSPPLDPVRKMPAAQSAVAPKAANRASGMRRKAPASPVLRTSAATRIETSSFGLSIELVRHCRSPVRRDEQEPVHGVQACSRDEGDDHPDRLLRIPHRAEDDEEEHGVECQPLQAVNADPESAAQGWLNATQPTKSTST
jgi:hypothetical protein